MANKRQFQLRPNCGSHRVINKDDEGAIVEVLDYKSGDIIESEVDLAAKFVNKFDEVLQAPPQAKPASDAKARARSEAAKTVRSAKPQSSSQE